MIFTEYDRALGITLILVVSLIMLILFGLAGAYVGEYSYIRGAARVAIGGSIALLVTFGIGFLFDTPQM